MLPTRDSYGPNEMVHSFSRFIKDTKRSVHIIFNLHKLAVKMQFVFSSGQWLLQKRSSFQFFYITNNIYT